LTLVLMFRLLSSFFPSPFLVTGLLLLFILNSPFFEYSLQFYPAVSATFFSLLAINALFCPFQEKWLNYLFIVIGLGFLPWLDQAFIPLSAGFFLVFLFYRNTKKFPWKSARVVSLFLCLLSLSYFYYFYSITGSPSPLSPFKLFGKIHGSFSTIPLGFFGHFFSRDFGLLWAYPHILFFFFGVVWGWKEKRKQSLFLLVIFFSYYLICSAAVTWTGDTLPPGRFLVPLFPVFLIFIGFTFQNLYQYFSYPKLLFYLVYLILVILNKKIWLVNLNFSPGYLTSSDWPRIMVSFIILFFLYLSFVLGRLFLFPEKIGTQKENTKKLK